MDILKALQYGWPDSKYSLVGHDYSGLKWAGTDTKPTLDDIEEAWNEYVKKAKYIDDRRIQYSEGAKLHEMIVALWEKVVEGKSEKCDEIQIFRQRVKNMYPKGDE